MVIFDSEQSSTKSLLRLSGRLRRDDATELKRLLYNSVIGISSLEINLDHVTESSNDCNDTFRLVMDELVKTGKNLVFVGNSSHFPTMTH